MVLARREPGESMFCYQYAIVPSTSSCSAISVLCNEDWRPKHDKPVNSLSDRSAVVPEGIR